MSKEEMGTEPLRDFLDRFDRELRAEQGWLRWAWNKARARVMVRWRLRLHYWLHPESLRHVSQEAFDLVAADTETIDAFRTHAASMRKLK